MHRLSSPVSDLEDHYDVVIVGSGYGGAVAASRLARARTSRDEPLSVCVLERGREIRPGEYSDTLGRVVGETQIDTASRHLFSRTGLYDFRLNNEMHVLVGCGLGGTSLINANVAALPERWVLEDKETWPQALIKDIDHGFREGLSWALVELDPVPYGDQPQAVPLRKLGALSSAGSALGRGAKVERANLNISFGRSTREVRGRGGIIKVEHHPCQLCGDCVSGCNYGAKSSLLMNYLPDARAHGARMFTEVAVRRLERRGGRWIVHYELVNAGRERFGSPDLTIAADFVILAAGTLGSTEILRRSQQMGLGAPELTLSPQVGSGFSGNGGGSVEPPRSRGSLREDRESLPSAGRSRPATLTLPRELLAAFLCPYWQRFALARLVTPVL